MRAITLPDMPVTLAGYCAVHQHLFQDLYDWAGEFRTVMLSKGNAPFCHARYIASFMCKQFEQLARENNLTGLSLERFAERAAFHVVEFNSIHPFREGNGRTIRIFLQMLARQAGHDFLIEHIDRDDWMKASIIGHHQADSALMARVIADVLAKSR